MRKSKRAFEGWVSAHVNLAAVAEPPRRRRPIPRLPSCAGEYSLTITRARIEG
jgi:hypothetical protein